MQATERPQLKFEYPHKFHHGLTTPSRYKCFYGGRGSAKSWTIARYIVLQMMTAKHLVLCCREFQNSISDSVHRLISDQVDMLGFAAWFDITQTSIKCRLTGSECIFKGLRRSIQEIKSTEGATICWVEEAASVSEDSWLILDPTIRREGAVILISFNTDSIDDPTYKRFVVSPPPDCITTKVGWQDNPWFPSNQDKIRQHMLNSDPDAYDWVWEGHARKINEAAIFKGNYVIEGFETPEVVDRFFFGADWGFANDPTALVRCFIKDEVLYVDYEAFAVGIEIDDIPALFRGGVAMKTGAHYPGIPGAESWPIRADAARPETISYIGRRGFNVTAAEKWPGSVEDGIAHLKGFRRIVVHERCINLAQEMRLYSYKVDKQTKDILPVVEDKHNHGLDALRYSLDGVIQKRGGLSVWAKLAGGQPLRQYRSV